jgi:endonuclease III
MVFLMTNQEIIEKIYKLQLLLKGKNGPVASALERATIPLIEHEKALYTASLKDLLEITGIGEATAVLILKIIKGEHVYDIAATVPKPKRKPKWA